MYTSMDGKSKMKKNLLLIGFVFSLSINLAVFFTITYNWWRGREVQSQETPFISKGLRERLNPEQLEEIRNLRRTALARAKKLREALKNRRELLIEELNAPEPDREKIDEILRDISRLQFELEKEVIDNLLRVSELLPPKQREKVLNLMLERLREPRRRRVPRHPPTPERFEGR